MQLPTESDRAKKYGLAVIATAISIATILAVRCGKHPDPAVASGAVSTDENARERQDQMRADLIVYWASWSDLSILKPAVHNDDILTKLGRDDLDRYFGSRRDTVVVILAPNSKDYSLVQRLKLLEFFHTNQYETVLIQLGTSAGPKELMRSRLID